MTKEEKKNLTEQELKKLELKKDDMARAGELFFEKGRHEIRIRQINAEIQQIADKYIGKG